MPTLPIVLLVDDDYTTNFLNRSLLEYFDPTAQVLVALNGQEALELLRTHCQPRTCQCPALVLLDLNMPVLDGFGFLEAFQQFPPAHQDVVIVVLTTSVNPHDMARIQGLPVAGILAKPLSEAKIAQVLTDHLPPRPAA